MPDEATMLARELADAQTGLQAAHAAWEAAVDASIAAPADKDLADKVEQARAAAVELVGRYHETKLRSKEAARRSSAKA